MPSKRHAALGFIFITIMLDAIAFGIIAPILPKLITNFVGGDIARSSEYMGLFVTTWAVMQFFCSPIIGMLSDRFGRRPVVLLSNFGLGLDYIVMALAPTLSWLFLGRIFSGVTSSTITTANAYVSDVTTPENRSKAYGLFGAAFGIGFVLGPALGGWLGATSPRLPFWVAACCSLLNSCYGLFVLPESLAPENRQPAMRWRNANPLGALRLLRSHQELFGLAMVNFLGFLAHEVYTTVWVLYVIFRYNWGDRLIGISLALVGVTFMIVSAGLVGPFVKRFGDRAALFAGLFLGALGFILYGIAGHGWLIFVAICVNALWGLAGPPQQTLMTQRVSASEQGELQGALGSLRGIAMIFGPGLFSSIFAYSIVRGRSLAGAPWYLAGALLLASLALARVVFTPRDAARAVERELEQAAAG